MIISRGIELLIQKFCKISIFAHILDNYFDADKFIITRKTIPLSIVLSELVFHMSGQLSRLCFDKSRKYKTASLCELYKQIVNEMERISDQNINQIKSDFNGNPAKGIAHIEKFCELKNSIELLKTTYKEKLELLADKHYAHLEVRTEDEIKEDYKIFQLSWDNIKKLIETAKELIFEINLFWNNSDTDFADTQYDDFKRRFWNLISLPDRNSTEFWTQDSIYCFVQKRAYTAPNNTHHASSYTHPDGFFIMKNCN